jgi:hypothetical protein
MSAPAPLPASFPEFSDEAIEQLNRALQFYVSSWDEVRHATLRLSLERLCSEAHAAQLGPERMLVAVKAAWGRVPGIERVDIERARVAFERVVGYCIEAYYGEGTRSEEKSDVGKEG